MELNKSFAEIILNYLAVAGRGVTTRKVAEKTKMSWATARKYLSWMNQGGIVEIYMDNKKVKWRIREELLDMPTKEQTMEILKALPSPTKLKKIKEKYNP